MAVTLTIFTPTYNRKTLLLRLYDSLRKQTCKDFEWLVVDDGSTDDTAETIKALAEQETTFQIRYLYKENGGLGTGYVAAYQNLRTELCACVDSDDWLKEYAVADIIAFWRAREDRDQFAGILALDCDPEGNVLGGLYPEETQKDNLLDIEFGRSVHKKADRMLIIRSELCRQAKPMKMYPNETSINGTYMAMQISEKYDFLVLNKPLYVVEYQESGISKNKFKHYLKSPNYFADYRLYLMGLKTAPFLFTVRHAIHYCSSCILARRPLLRDCPRKLLAILCYPVGALLTLYIRTKVKTKQK